MKSLFAKIFVAIAFCFLLGHNLITHHHHDEIEITQHHHDDANHDDNIFSFGQLDHHFLISQSSFSANTFSVLCFLFPDNFRTTELNFSKCKVNFAFVVESPPPDKHFPSSFHRGPPTV